MMYDYQSRIVKEAFESSSQKVVIAAPPGSGKTRIACDLIRKYSDAGYRTLVLTHNTNVIKDNFQKGILEYFDDHGHCFSHSTDIEQDSQCIVSLPCNVVKHLKNLKFDVLIVDEAHHNYPIASCKDGNQKTVKKIIAAIKPRHQILLTATPEEFNIYKDDYHIIYLPAIELPENRIHTNVLLMLCSSKYFNRGDFAGEYVRENYDYKSRTTRIMNDLLNKIYDRLLTEETSNSTAKMIVMKCWSSIFRSLGKTIVYCNNSSHANEVYKYFCNKIGSGKVGLSTHERDPSSSVIEQFRKNDGSIDVLILLRRGRIGFDKHDLFSILDLSLSKNISDNYQTMGRLFRPNKQDPQMRKMYIKVVPESEDWQYEFFVMRPAIMLMTYEGLSTYTGRFSSIRIPITSTEKIIGKSSRKSSRKNKFIMEPYNINDKLMEWGKLLSFNHPPRKANEELSVVSYITLEELRYEMLEKKYLSIDEIMERLEDYEDSHY